MKEVVRIEPKNETRWQLARNSANDDISNFGSPSKEANSPSDYSSTQTDLSIHIMPLEGNRSRVIISRGTQTKSADVDDIAAAVIGSLALPENLHQRITALEKEANDQAQMRDRQIESLIAENQRLSSDLRLRERLDHFDDLRQRVNRRPPNCRPRLLSGSSSDSEADPQ